MDYLPISIDLRARVCLVVGGGPVALRKVALLLEAGARVRIVAPELCPALRELTTPGALGVAQRAYAERDMDGISLVIAATNDVGVNAQVASDARIRGIPVNVVDSPELCSFIMPAIVDRSPILVAVSTAGASPVLARMIRAQIETVLPATLGALAEFAALHRDAVKQTIPEQGARRLFWEKVLEGEIGQLVLSERPEEAEQALKSALVTTNELHTCNVALIAVASSDPDRLALGALRWLSRTDLLLHEAAVSERVLGRARRDAERVDIGKLSAPGGWSLQRLTEAVVTRVGAGGSVCLLRDGDPYMRGAGEESLWLRTAGIRVEVWRPAPAPSVYLRNPLTELDE